MEYYVLIHCKGGFTVGAVTHKTSKSDWVDIEIVTPFTGSNSAMQSYYTKGRRFRTPYKDCTDCPIYHSCFCTKESHPEYFI